MLQDNLYETYDTSIVDVCYGIGATVNLTTINGNKYDKLSKVGRMREIMEDSIDKPNANETKK
jgi:hypothetical protein